MIDALKKALKEKSDGNFAIVIAKVKHDEDKSDKMGGQAPPAKEHKEMVGDDALDQSMSNLDGYSDVEKEIANRDDDGGGGLISKVKEMLMKSKKKV